MPQAANCTSIKSSWHFRRTFLLLKILTVIPYRTQFSIHQVSNIISIKTKKKTPVLHLQMSKADVVAVTHLLSSSSPPTGPGTGCSPLCKHLWIYVAFHLAYFLLFWTCQCKGECYKGTRQAFVHGQIQGRQLGSGLLFTTAATSGKWSAKSTQVVIKVDCSMIFLLTCHFFWWNRMYV